jgi:hypothetical protein
MSLPVPIMPGGYANMVAGPGRYTFRRHAPPDRERLHAVFTKVASDPEVIRPQQRVQVITSKSPEEFAASKRAKWENW